MTKDESAYGKGFLFRIVLLLGVMGLIVGGYYYDKNLVQGADERVNEILLIQEFANKKTKDADRISRSDVQAMIRNWANLSTREYTQAPPKGMHDDEEFMASFEPITFEIETYKFKRIVPGLDTQLVEIAYLNDVAMFSQTGSAITDRQLDWGFDLPPENDDSAKESEF